LGQDIVIDGAIRVRVVSVKGGGVRLGIMAPDSVRVDRGEVHARRAEFDDEAVFVEAAAD
jgi:carbon storage regulator CsrA